MSFRSGEEEEVRLVPLASGCDMRVVAAPPIVYYGDEEHKQVHTIIISLLSLCYMLTKFISFAQVVSGPV